MTATRMTRSAETRAKLGHPVIDVDGHMVELTPVLADFISQVGGRKVAEAYYKAPSISGFYHNQGMNAARDLRRERWNIRTGWGGPRTRKSDGSDNTLDLATVRSPKLLNERMDDFGIDYMVLFPSEGMFTTPIRDPEVRRAAVRGFNTYAMALYGEYPDRMTPVGVIPMHTPQEAVEELDYAVNVLGMKTLVLDSFIRRPIPAAERVRPDFTRYAYRLDFLGIDSAYDYDPVWAKCRELKIAPTFHAGALSWPTFGSISNYNFNHTGSLAISHTMSVKAIFLGGVTRRFPELRFAWMEGGVAWACNVFSDLVNHWEKRNVKAVMEQLDPANYNLDRVMELIDEYGGEKVAPHSDAIREFLARPSGQPEELDDFKACGIERAEDIRDLFAPRFFFGCEADDPMMANAFNRKANPFGAAIHAVMGSDIGHWDVVDSEEIVEEAYELVERGAVTKEDFREFAFVNPVRLYAAQNPDFFKGSRVEGEVEKLKTTDL